MLQRIARARKVEHLKALDALAEASAEQSKLGRLHQRSTAIARGVTTPLAQKAGAALTTGLRFRGQLHALAQSTEQLQADASSRNQRAQQQAEQAKLRLRQIEDRSRDLDRKISRHSKRRRMTTEPILARHLLMSDQTTDAQDDKS